MRRRTLLGLAGALGISSAAAAVMTYQGAVPFVSFPPPTRRVARVGLLNAGDAADPANATVQAFLARMREHGWTEEQNLVVEWRASYGDADPHRLAALAAELIALRID